MTAEATKVPCCKDDLTALKVELKTSVAELYKMYKTLSEELATLKFNLGLRSASVSKLDSDCKSDEPRKLINSS